MSTHIEAGKNDIAKIVLMPGDPLRAKMIAETYLDDAKLVNRVRNMLAYTGYYKNQRITVMGSGMGMPSMGIYAYELFAKYDVDTIIRIGTAGSYTEKLDVYDTVLVKECYSDCGDVYKREACAQPLLDKVIKEEKCECVEMESYALFHTAEIYHKQSACLLTISDSMVSNQKTSSEERETKFVNMIEIALESTLQL